MEKARRNENKRLVFQAFQELRDIYEAQEYIFKTHNKKVPINTIYHHIRRVRNNEEDNLSLYQYGTQYKFIESANVENIFLNKRLIDVIKKHIEDKSQYQDVNDFVKVAIINQINYENPSKR